MGWASYLEDIRNKAIDNLNNTKERIESLPNNIRIQFLSTYCSELNPIETCWKTTRHDVTNSTFFSTIEKMLNILENYWKRNKFILNFINYLCP